MRHLTASLLTIFLLLTAARPQVQPNALSNEDVIQMVALGLSDDVIVEKIRSAGSTNFDTSVDGLKLLKAAKVSDLVLKAMINPHGQSGTVSGRVVDEMAIKFKQLQNGVVTV